MPDRTLDIAFVMDPIEGVDIDADTTFVLMLEAQLRGHRIYTVDQADLGVGADGPTARIRPVTVRRERGRHFDAGSAQQRPLDEMDVVFQRKDPPVDADYVAATQILRLCRRARVLNRPAGILAANEKLYALLFEDLLPPTRVTRSQETLLAFLDELGGEMIVKPLDGKGGEGVFHVHRKDRNLNSILEQSTRFGETWAMAQAYLPAVREGDKRILLVEGEPLGAILRVPAEDEVRANLHVGGLAKQAHLTDDDRRIIARIRPWLERDGLFFVGIDVIGGKLTEINVTSPTGIQELDALDGTNAEAHVIDRIEALVSDGGEDPNEA